MYTLYSRSLGVAFNVSTNGTSWNSLRIGNRLATARSYFSTIMSSINLYFIYSSVFIVSYVGNSIGVRESVCTHQRTLLQVEVVFLCFWEGFKKMFNDFRKKKMPMQELSLQNKKKYLHWCSQSHAPAISVQKQNENRQVMDEIKFILSSWRTQTTKESTIN